MTIALDQPQVRHANNVDTDRWGLSTRIQRKLTRRLDAYTTLIYNDQSSESGTAGRTSDFTNWLLFLGVKFRFEPMEVW